MPLLVCPNDSASMQSVQRNGVEFDFCPTCRGVWLDRGELEKLMASTREDDLPEERPAPRRDEPRRYEDERRNDDDRRRDERPMWRGGDDDDRGGYRKKKGFSLFDIFD